jgi:hypothetical protein
LSVRGGGVVRSRAASEMPRPCVGCIVQAQGTTRGPTSILTSDRQWRLSEVCFGSSRATVNHSRLRQICIRDLTNIQYLISAGIINKISNFGYGCAGEAGEPGAEEERPDEQYENRNRN